MRIPAHVAVVVIIERGGRFLLVEEDRGPGGRVWYFPSGALEPGETLAGAARREVCEESGYDVAPERIIAINHGLFSDPEGLHWWRFVVSARIVSDDPVAVNEQDMTAVAWLTIGEIENLALRSIDAAQLCLKSRSGCGLAISDALLSADGRFEGFYG